MGLLRRKRRQASPAQAVSNPRSATRVLLVNALLGLAGYAIRAVVTRRLARGPAGQPAAPGDGAGPATGPAADPAAGPAPASLPDRLATTVATAVATRSVPGAVLVGGVMGLRALYRRGKARRAARAGNPEAKGN